MSQETPLEEGLGESTYRWVIWRTEFPLGPILRELGLAAAFVIGFCTLFLWLIGLVSEPAAFWIGVVLTGFLLLVLVLSLMVLPMSKTEAEKARNRQGIYSGALLSLGFLFYLLFSRTSFLNEGYSTPPNAGFGEWLVFLLDQTLSVVLLDLPELLNWHISPIRPVSGFARGLTVMIRLLIGIGLVSAIYQAIRLGRARRVIYGSLRDCYEICKRLPGKKTLQMQREGIVDHKPDGPSSPIPNFIAWFEDKKTDEGAEAYHEVPFDRNDITVHEWTLSYVKDDDTMSNLTSAVITTLVAPLVLLIFAWAIGLLSTGVAFWISIILFLAFLSSFASLLNRVRKERQSGQFREAKDVYYTGACLVGLMLFLFSIPIFGQRIGFHYENEANLGQWILFYFDNLTSVVFLDGFDLYEIHMSKVRVDSPASRLLTFLFRVFITFGVVVVLRVGVTAMRRRNVFRGTVQECFWYCEALPDSDDMVVQQTGTVRMYDNPKAVPVKLFLDHYKPQFDPEKADSTE